MTGERATGTCPDCDLDADFETLAAARSRIETHRAEVGHDPTWELRELDEGVERAGDDAGVCGRPECTNDDSPLVRDDL
ncbi:hypothetical protein BRC82_08215 [Halobacteriales archaeon QS_1_67_19]|nr:MAG: hypothetical protein BRC82_08215 [Halobacteriales archaeon QS_1_67_19]